jgi:hypothetical protein
MTMAREFLMNVLKEKIVIEIYEELQILVLLKKVRIIRIITSME